MLTKNAKREQTIKVGVSLLNCGLPEYGDEEFCDIQAAYIPVCPLPEAHNGRMFSHTDCNTINFISQSIMAFVRANGLFKLRAKNNQPCMDDAIMPFVEASSMLCKCFKEK